MFDYMIAGAGLTNNYPYTLITELKYPSGKKKIVSYPEIKYHGNTIRKPVI
jgi:hypothetical protein